MLLLDVHGVASGSGGVAFACGASGVGDSWYGDGYLGLVAVSSTWKKE